MNAPSMIKRVTQCKRLYFCNTTTLVAAHVGESLPLLTLAVMQKMSPSELAAVIYCFPTQIEAIQQVAAQASQ